MPFRLLSNVFPPLLWGVGHPRMSASNYLVAAILMPISSLVVIGNALSVERRVRRALGEAPAAPAHAEATRVAAVSLDSVPS